MNKTSPIQVLAMMEASSVTGPAKNLIGFCQWLASDQGRESGIQMAIATFARAGSDNGFAQAAKAAGIDTHLIHERSRFDPGVVGRLREIVNVVAPDIIQTHNGKSHLLLRAMSDLRATRPWIAFQHGYQHTDVRLRLYNQVDRLSLRAADRVVSVCQAFAPHLTAFGVRADRIRVLHNAAAPVPLSSVEELGKLREQLALGVDEPVIVTIGRLSLEKGHGDLLRAIALLRSPRPWKLLVVGIGPEKARLEKLAAELGIRNRVVFAGFWPKVSAFYRLASVFVLPSRSEGSSNVLLEAMIAGVPIVATSVGGNPEILSGEETALMVPSGDVPALAVAIDRLLADSALAQRLAGAAYTRATRDFSPDSYRRRLLSYYDEVL